MNDVATNHPCGDTTLWTSEADLTKWAQHVSRFPCVWHGGENGPLLPRSLPVVFDQLGGVPIEPIAGVLVPYMEAPSEPSTR